MNCFTYAIRKCFHEGGYVCVRRSQLHKMFPRPWWHPVNAIPHFLHRDWHGNVSQYVPTHKQKIDHINMGLWRAWIDLWSFDGEVIGDDPTS